MDEKKREEIALFRYSLIVPFLSQQELEWGVKGELVQRMTKQIHQIPFSQKTSLHESTIRRYLKMYREQGFDGLKPNSRSDIGTSHKIPSEVLEKAFLLKREEPRRSAKKIIQLMEVHQWAPLGLLKPSTLSRILKQNGLTYKQLKQSHKSFLTELSHEKVDHLHQLNSKFWAWLEQEYHLNIHSVTNEPPLNRWRNNVASFLKKIEEKQLQAIFLWREKRKVSKLGLVSLPGIEFEVSSRLVGKTVEVKYNHFDRSQVFIYLDSRFIQTARPTKVSRWNKAQKQPPPQPPTPIPTSDIQHLKLLEQQHQQAKVHQAKQLLGQTKTEPTSPPFSSARFFKELAAALKRNVEHWHAHELDAMQQAWNQFGPFEPALVHIALAKAILDKKTDQHISFYLDYIIKTHINHQHKEQ